MKNFLTILATGALILTAQNFYSQNKQTNEIKVQNNELKFSADSAVNNNLTKTITFTGNASLNSKSITFENAEKIVYHTETNQIEILKPKNFKIYNLKALVKANSDNNELIIYDVKENVVKL